MKKIVLAAAVVGFAASAGFAGSMDAPIMEAPVIIEEATQAASSSSTGLVLPLLALAAIVAVIAN